MTQYMSDAELERAKKVADFEHTQKVRENEDRKDDQIRSMAWISLLAMLFYPVVIIGSTYFNMEDMTAMLSDIAPSYFMSIAGLLSAFFGAQAYTKGKIMN